MSDATRWFSGFFLFYHLLTRQSRVKMGQHGRRDWMGRDSALYQLIGVPMHSVMCRCYTLMTFTPLYPIYPTQFDFRQTGFDKIPLLLCGIRHKMISAERSAAFDRCGGICYNENTKGNTADRRSVPKVSYKNSNRVPRPKGGYFFV